ncbi:MAG: GNAT family N-acetyltransferase [Planctomycetes bacterium]|nr:GNAT family N-acetyltransferase [Planctomycetota bacterium]
MRAGIAVSAAQIFTNKEEFAWEFGPSTLPEFRRRGFATEACRAATGLILELGRIPWYYYDHYNAASARIPEKLGYSLYSEGLFSHNN